MQIRGFVLWEGQNGRGMGSPKVGLYALFALSKICKLSMTNASGRLVTAPEPFGHIFRKKWLKAGSISP
ncbi:MAG: hypothetical protein A2402_01695 [Candidatus Staskawiczbacteria bacterium RIFOXYC1_FULL_37_43]|nr:MAG: hypothetical protein A2813_01780 [Candidatus Staskawiczbacteria bacterium RIFCSPHIGHO2_01_FULL_37_17]OGZ72158.1 MAG: hypothetical protein A2891_02045 [Candidatus Staskawiczbacteria bacterium RIFCSPLOWO2_01_FULL_37_19]OGZ75473.1 MAG: hypothetical protein A2205_01700 [Candidatus Staskawiczbacteria bacterium RIFOXYA1_FULL_37_15]OGZ80461.1 MAG: hypothetical protein A2353_02965 [Candidatus Staskawiczbacteria bacterium RIFOXYB1_FULL_38_37]OGZ81261.1 MAG: hypothetical protein A2325_03540 [Cand